VRVTGLPPSELATLCVSAARTRANSMKAGAFRFEGLSGAHLSCVVRATTTALSTPGLLLKHAVTVEQLAPRASWAPAERLAVEAERLRALLRWHMARARGPRGSDAEVSSLTGELAGESLGILVL
jgi:hypothetical protein